MAEALALSMAKWVASPIISKLLNEGFSYLGMDVADGINKLEATIFPQLQEVIDAAEKHGDKSKIEKWLRRLKDAMYEAEDALDFYKYRLLQQKVKNDGTTMKKISNKLSSSLNILSTEEKNLKQCHKKLEKIALEAKDFRDFLERQVKINPSNSIKEPMVTTSIPPPRIFGRDADCDYLLKELLEPVTEPESSQVRSYSVYSIVGVGGAGKTTLAQLFYNHERVTGEFDLKIWLSMTRGLDLVRHTRILVEGSSNKECPHLDNFDLLQKFLNDSINSKKILVMMDDLWWDETMNEKWELFVAPLASVKRGSKILVTSRTENMPCALLPQKIMPLKNLEENQFFSLFMHHAFGDLEPNSTHSLESLEQIGKQIAKKLSRSPLATKAVGSRLRKNLDESFWRDTLERDMLTDTVQSLLWSYQNLDAPIQRCFSYCAIFPKGYQFDKEDLILLWVAEGFIHSSTRRMEDVGGDYFRELLSVFFFQEEYGIIVVGGKKYGMHDLFHDLAERVSMDDCFRIEDGELREIPLAARHLSIQGESFNEYITSVEKLKNLRSVIFIDPVSDDVINTFLKKIEKFSKLRVLEFCWCTIEKLPNSVGELVLLRYLGLSKTQVVELPPSIQKLYNLQTLRLSGISRMSITGWVASPIISKLLNEGFSYLEMDMAARIEKLDATILPQFQEVINAAEKHRCNTNFKKWLRQLKDAMYKAEDALNLYKYRLLQQKNDKTTMKKISNKLSSSFNILSTEEKNLKQCLNKLENIALEAKVFRDLLEIQVKINPSNSIKEPMVTTSIPPPRIFGRDADCDYLLKELLEPVTEPESSQVRSYSVYSIVGVGGAGKTTLAQLCYNHERVIAEFDLRIWLSMTRGLDLFHHTRMMVEGASKKKCPSEGNFDTLQGFLIGLIKSKKILVMMDDVWWDETMNEQKWEIFVAPFADIKRGSKILVTSRTENMPCALLPQKIMPLKNLEENQFFSLFMHHAFGDLEPNSTHSLESLEQIGKKIAKKLSRSHLAAKEFGSCLRKNLNEGFWRVTLGRGMLIDTMQSLLWSYQNLDAPIQRCFSYCAIFPKGYKFNKRDLILLWVAEGFIHSSTRRMEDVGDDYFQLLSVFFFQEGEYSEQQYVMHDLFHDLAERVSRNDCFRIQDGKLREIPLVARHLSIQGESFNEYITSVEKLKNLRSVIFIDPVSDDVINTFLTKIEKFSKLRVLEFCWCTIEKLPNSVGELVLLRYLGLSQTQIVELPPSIQKLYNLQTLRLNLNITHLPRGLNKLVNLRHLQSFIDQETSTLYEIGNLTSLQNLDDFWVKNEKGSEISQLKHLNEIRGSLRIHDLKNIKNMGDATEAHLKDKKRLQHLSLQWGHDDAMDGNLNAHLEVLEGLEPHSNLKDLKIEGYKSPMPPSWMFQQGSHDNLISLELRKCPSLEVLPPISTLFPCLERIIIEKLPKITKLPLFPLSLKELDIRECWSLVFIYEEELQKCDYEVRLLKAMQDCQFNLILENIPDIKDRARRKLFEECSELRRLMEWESHGKVNDIRVLAMNIERAEITADGIWEAHLQLIKLRMEYIYSKKEKYPLIVPPGLEILRISSCYITDEALMHCLAQLTCLKSLHLEGIRTITVLPPKEVFCQLAVLNHLTIDRCDYLISLGGLHALVSKELYIRDCPCLEIPGKGGRGTLPSSLEFVEISDCYSIRHFQVIDLQSLSRATFSNCEQLKSMELRNLPSLKELEIKSCRELQLIYSNMPVLETLNVEKCFALQENFSSGNMAWASLKKIGISSFSMLGKLPSRGELVNLEDLRIYRSNESFFNEDEFRCLTSLDNLVLDDCEVKALPCSMKNFYSLRRISLWNCHELLSLPDMPDILQYLTLGNCPAIASLPVLPKSLQELRIHYFPMLSKRCQEPDGEDWPKISHVRQRYVQ